MRHQKNCLNAKPWPLIAALAISVFGSPCVLPSLAIAAPIKAALPLKANASHFERGVEALSTGDLSTAQSAFEKVSAKEPEHAKALLALAEIARLRANPGQSEEYLRRAMQHDGRNTDVQMAWAKWLNGQGKPDDAILTLEAATRESPTAAAAWVELGVLYARNPNTRTKALDAFREALKHDPKLAGAQFALGTVLIGAGQPEEAAVALNEAARLNPTDPRPWEMLGRLHASQGKTDDAFAAYRKAVALDANYISARLAIGDLELRNGQIDKAAEAFATSVQINPNADAAWLRIGLLEQSQGRTDEADRAYRRAIEANPNQAIALNNLAALLTARAGDLPEALALAQRAVAISPNAAFLGTLSGVYRAQGDIPKATEYAARADEARTTTERR